MSILKNEREVLDRLRVKYKAPEYAFFRHVRNSTGHSAKVRTIDAMAMSLWPSRGLELHGFEVKVSRSDWLSEMKKPEKQEEFFRHCDRFWLVVGDSSIVKAGELPKGWGLIVPHGAGLSIKTHAPELDPEPVPKRLLAAIMRKGDDPDETGRISAAAEAKVRKSLGERLAKTEALETELRMLKAKSDVALHSTEALREFEKFSGITINQWNLPAARRAGALVMAIEAMADETGGSLHRMLRGLRHSFDRFEAVVGVTRECLDTADRLLDEVGDGDLTEGGDSGQS